MATKRKGCGFLMTALVLLLIGGGIATYLGMNAYSSFLEFTEKFHAGTTFSPPNTVTYQATESGEVSVWLTGTQMDALSSIQIQVTDTSTGDTITATKPDGDSTFEDQHLVASFEVKKDDHYNVSADGLAEGRILTLAEVGQSTVFAVLGQGLGALFGGGAVAFLALIFGIIGLVMFLSSKPTAQ